MTPRFLFLPQLPVFFFIILAFLFFLPLIPTFFYLYHVMSFFHTFHHSSFSLSFLFQFSVLYLNHFYLSVFISWLVSSFCFVVKESLLFLQLFHFLSIRFHEYVSSFSFSFRVFRFFCFVLFLLLLLFSLLLIVTIELTTLFNCKYVFIFFLA